MDPSFNLCICVCGGGEGAYEPALEFASCVRLGDGSPNVRVMHQLCLFTFGWTVNIGQIVLMAPPTLLTVSNYRVCALECLISTLQALWLWLGKGCVVVDS